MIFSDTKKKSVVLVSPVFNRIELTLQCLKSIGRLNIENLEIHTIIVDDGSTDGTEDQLKKNHPEVQIVKGDGNLYYTEGFNKGVEAALKHNPDYILGFNNDSIFDEDCLNVMVQCAEKYPKSVIGAILLLWDTPHKVFQVSPKWVTKYGGWRHWYKQTIWTIPDKPWEVGIIVGNCVLFPTEVIRQLGFMDEKKFVQFGDAEYTPRMRKNGWQLLIEPKARVFCKPNDEAVRLRNLPKTEMLKILFTDSPNGHNLYRWYRSNIAGAPNKLEGLIAFGVILKNLVTGFRPHNLPEKPLSETFADKILDN